MTTANNKDKGIPMKMIATIGTITVVLLGLGFAGMVKSGGQGKTTASSLFEVKRGSLLISVTESGSLKAQDSVNILCEVDGRSTIINLVEEGKFITQEDIDNGMILAEMDSSGIEERLTTQEITFASAEAADTEARKAFEIQLSQNNSDRKAAELKVRFAQLDLEKYLGKRLGQELLAQAEVKAPVSVEDAEDKAEELLIRAVDEAQVLRLRSQDAIEGAADALEDQSVSVAANEQIFDEDYIDTMESDEKEGGEAIQKVRELRDKISLAEGKLKQAEDKLEWTRKLSVKGYATQIELERDELDVASQNVAFKQAQTALALFRRYEFPKEAEKFLSDYHESLRALARTRAQAEAKIAQAQAKSKSAQAKYKLEKSKLERYVEQMAACTIRAQTVGMVVYGTPGRGHFRGGSDQQIALGAEVRRRQQIFSIPNTQEMTVDTKVHETEIDKIKLGQRAVITVDALPDTRFTGTVTKVGLLPDSNRSWMTPDLKVYATEVLIDGGHEELRPGMNAKVEIIVEQLSDVVYVPLQAVANRSGKKLCYVQSAGGLEEREVTVGNFNQNFIAIYEGLEDGEFVSLKLKRQWEEQPLEEIVKLDLETGDRAESSVAGAASSRDSSQGGEREGAFGRVPRGDGEGNRQWRERDGQRGAGRREGRRERANGRQGSERGSDSGSLTTNGGSSGGQVDGDSRN